MPARGVHDLLGVPNGRLYLPLPSWAAWQFGFEPIGACRIDEEVMAGDQVRQTLKVKINTDGLHIQIAQRLGIVATRNRSDFAAARQGVPYDCLADMAGGAQNQYSSKPLCHRGVSNESVQ